MLIWEREAAMAVRSPPRVRNSMAIKLLAKIAVIVAQSSWLTVLLGYILFRTQWVVLPAAVSIVVLMILRCSSCGTSFQDERIYQRFRLLRFYDSRIINNCPVCHNPMFGK